jgi:hypothetical protein
MFFLLLLATGIHSNAQTKAKPKGTLFIIGGGNRSEALIKQISINRTTWH